MNVCIYYYSLDKNKTQQNIDKLKCFELTTTLVCVYFFFKFHSMCCLFFFFCTLYSIYLDTVCLVITLLLTYDYSKCNNCLYRNLIMKKRIPRNKRSYELIDIFVYFPSVIVLGLDLTASIGKVLTRWDLITFGKYQKAAVHYKFIHVTFFLFKAPSFL